MNTRNTIAALLLVTATSFAGISSANISTGSLGTDVQSAVGQGQVSATVTDGVATLFGSVETRADVNAAKSAALSFPGVDEVVSAIVISN